jgi:hypothetical protein
MGPGNILLNPHLKMELPASEVPSYDGSEDKALGYFQAIAHLATVRGSIPQQLGSMMFVRFETGSAIEGWWNTRSPETQQRCARDYCIMIQEITDTWLGEQWARNLHDQYNTQSFREKGHSTETPTEYAIRHVMLGRLLHHTVDIDGPKEVHSVLVNMPLDWQHIINLHELQSISGLIAQLQLHKEALI